MGSVIMMRSFKEGISSWLTPEARQRARELLLARGYLEEHLKPIEWPDDAVSAHRDHSGQPWQFTTRADIRHRRQKSAKEVLWMKREFGVLKRQPLYVWVFYNPNWIYTGWYTYLIGTGISHALNFRSTDTKMIERLMQLFPLVEPTLFGPGDFELWMKKFVKRYKVDKPGNRRQGKAPVWAEVTNGNAKAFRRVERITERGYWTANKSA